MGRPGTKTFPCPTVPLSRDNHFPKRNQKTGKGRSKTQKDILKPKKIRSKTGKDVLKHE